MLRSIVAQSETCRVVLVDDASDDGSAGIARDIGGEKVEVIQHATRQGIAANWNFAASLADTEYFALVHQDDWYVPEFVSTMVDALTAEPGAALAHCKVAAMDASGGPINAPAERFKERFWQRAPAAMDRAAHWRLLYEGNWIACPSVLWRRAAFVKTGPFAIADRFAMDWRQSFRALAAGFGIVSVSNTLLRYRRHDASATASATAHLDRYDEELDVLSSARTQGMEIGGIWERDPGSSPALRRIVLQDALVDLDRRDGRAAAAKLSWLRRNDPRAAQHATVRGFGVASRLGAPGRWALRAARRILVGAG